MNDHIYEQLIVESPAEQLESRQDLTKEKEKLAAELIIADTELAFQNEKKEKLTAELILADTELTFQNMEKEKRAAELVITNKELAFQNKENDRRVAELIIANKELAFQNEEKEKRAAELIIANKELAFQSKEKEKRAAELIIANKELAFQNKEKEKRAAELIIANRELTFQNREKGKRAAEQKKLETYNNNLKQMVEEKVKEISESQMATIFALAKLAEARDDDTGEHLKRVQLLCRLIAEKLGLRSDYKDRINADYIDNLQEASPLHDIGKVGIRDGILLKPGKLTAEEFEEMKQHTLIGANTLKEVYQNYPNNYFVKIGIEIARSHHENWDGSGYPDGLCGDEIPLSAQIMALVDVYDALRSKRVYKDAYSNSEAKKIIIEGSNKHFNPLIVETFVEFEQEFDKVYI